MTLRHRFDRFAGTLVVLAACTQAAGVTHASARPAGHGDAPCAELERDLARSGDVHELATEIARRHDEIVVHSLAMLDAEQLAGLPRSVELGVQLARLASTGSRSRLVGVPATIDVSTAAELTLRLARDAPSDGSPAETALAVLDGLAREGCLSRELVDAARRFHARNAGGNGDDTGAYLADLRHTFGSGQWAGVDALAAAVIAAVGESSALLWTDEALTGLPTPPPQVLSDIRDADALGAAAGAVIGGMTGVGLGLIGSAGAGPLAPLVAGVTVGAGAKGGAAVGGAVIGAGFSIATALGEDGPEPVGDEPGGGASGGDPSGGGTSGGGSSSGGSGGATP